MIHKTRGIVFHSFKYAETSLITRIYTEKFGLQGYLVKGARKPKAKLKASLFQPLFLLEMEVYRKEKSSLQTIREARNACIFKSLPFDVRKSAIAMFLGDVLTKTIREEESNRELFSFLDAMIRKLDEQVEDVADFHLVFLVHLSRFLGFFPRSNYDEKHLIFDMEEGFFTGNRPAHLNYIPHPLSKHLDNIIRCRPLEQLTLGLKREMRSQLLEYLIKYYHLHFEGLKEIQSHHVLKEIFD